MTAAELSAEVRDYMADLGRRRMKGSDPALGLEEP